jgi:hypothetical protein
VTDWPPRFADLPRSPAILQAIPLASHGLVQIVVLRQFQGRPQYRFTGHPSAEDAFRAMTPEQRAAFDLLWGPIRYGIQRSIPGFGKGLRIPFLTMLRDPVERIIAHYYFVLSAPTHYLYNRVTSANWSLHDYIANQTTIELDNDQVRCLNSVPHRQIPWGKVSRTMLDDAKAAIAHEDTIFGLSEFFDETLLVYARAMGWHDVRYLGRGMRSVTPQAPTIPGETLDLIRETNALDIELYEYARGIFEERLARLGAPFQEELRQYREANDALLNHPNWSNQLGEIAPADGDGSGGAGGGASIGGGGVSSGGGGASSGVSSGVSSGAGVPPAAQAAADSTRPGTPPAVPNPPRDITWLASYPRSGNTWLRFLLDTYFFPPARYMQEVGRLSGELDWWLAEARRLNHDVSWIPSALQRAQAKYQRPDGFPGDLFFKTHFERTPIHPLIERSKAAILLVRNPRDVLLSGMNFSELTEKPAAAASTLSSSSPSHAPPSPPPSPQRDYALDFIARRGDASWIRAGYGTWAGHTRSWSGGGRGGESSGGPDFPILTIRYEDLKSDTEAQLARILEFLSIPVDRHRLRQAIEHCSLSRLRNLEVSSRAMTDITALKNRDKYFFNKGLSNQSLSAFGEDLDAAFDAAFGEDAAALGYR